MIGQYLAGKKVNLRSLREEDLSRRIEWLSDEETSRFFTGTPPLKRYVVSDAERWRTSLEADITATVWAIETKYHLHIGDIDIHSVDPYYKSGKITILVGDKDYWGQGYGTDAMMTLLNHAFTDMRLLNIDLRVFAFNIRGIRCYKKCGFMESKTPSPGQMGASEPGEVYMTVSRERFLSGIKDVNAV